MFPCRRNILLQRRDNAGGFRLTEISDLENPAQIEKVSR